MTLAADHDRSPNELSLEQVIQEVLARNPSIEEMAARWEAVTSRYPQVVSLEDPMAGVTIGPASIGSRSVDFAYRLETSQKLPYPGKRALRGDAAKAEASAASLDVDNLRLELVQSAKNAFYDYFLVARALEVNAESVRLLTEFQQNAETQYRTGVASQQDVLQTTVELARQRERELQLRRMRQVAKARLNTLMHHPIDAPLPPPPANLAADAELLDVAALRHCAVTSRPDLQALTSRLAADQAALALAKKEFAPDFEVMAAYDAFWQPEERDLRPMVGVRINIPVRKERRYAAVREAQSKLAARSASIASLTDRIQFEVQEAFEQVRESREAVQLYRERILPAAEENIKSAQSAYVTGKIPFLTLITAQRDLVGLRDRYYEAIAEYFRRKAMLERAIGAPLGDRQGELVPYGPQRAAGTPS